MAQAEKGLFQGAVGVLLRDLVHERTGLWFENGKLDMFEDKLMPAIEAGGLRSPIDLYYRLKDEHPGEWERIIDALSVQETYFWREIDQLRAVVHELVPRWIAALGGRPLRIWSVPCATGEEPLTLAMLLDDGGWFGRAPIELYASDASPAALARAESGRFRERSFRTLPPALRARYFTPEDGEWRIASSLHRRIRWSLVNVNRRSEADPLADCPIIVCRNLFIYFSEASMRRVVYHFAARMPPGGGLCLGVSESLLRITDLFELRSMGGAFVYVKPGMP